MRFPSTFTKVGRNIMGHQIWFFYLTKMMRNNSHPFCRFKVPRKTPNQYTKKGDGEKILQGLCPPCTKLAKPKPPMSGAFKKRDNPPNSLVRPTMLKNTFKLNANHNIWMLNFILKDDVLNGNCVCSKTIIYFSSPSARVLVIYYCNEVHLLIVITWPL